MLWSQYTESVSLINICPLRVIVSLRLIVPWGPGSFTCAAPCWGAIFGCIGLAFRGTHVFNRSAGDRVLSGRRWRELQRGLREGLACRPSMRPACDYGCCKWFDSNFIVNGYSVIELTLLSCKLRRKS